MMLNCLIVDDEPIARKLLEEYIGETDFLTLVAVAENPLKTIGLMVEKDIDLIYLDINMPKMSGMEFLRAATHLPMVILTTAYGQYALEGFEMAVVDYLVKPFSLERFIRASQKALELKMLKGKPDHFFVKSDGILRRINFNDLLYIEAMENYVTIYTDRDKWIVYLTLKRILEDLSGANFIQVHKSMIVNTDKITSIEGNLLQIGSERITVGQHFYQEVMEKLLKGKYLRR